MLSNKIMGTAKAVEPAYVEDVFSTYLYTGNGATQTINNNIDLAGKGGLVWVKQRGAATSHILSNQQGTFLSSDYSGPLTTLPSFGVTAFNSNGFTLNDTVDSQIGVNYPSGSTYASWTFRKQPKFFDVVTWTGNGSSSRQIPHSLGSTPGMVITKSTSDVNPWYTYHRSLGVYSGEANGLVLNETVGVGNYAPPVTAVDSTTITVSNILDSNINGRGYVAYIFAHNAGGFGLSGNENVVSCGSFTTDGSGFATVNLGYEAQWALVKKSSSTGAWAITDNMRGWTTGAALNTSDDAVLFPNISNAEVTQGRGYPTATGFSYADSADSTYIYIAIRRGPMKVPTNGTKVFNAIVRTGTGAAATITGVGFAPDLVSSRNRTSAFQNLTEDRLRGVTKRLMFDASDAEDTQANAITSFNMDGITVGADGTGSINYAGGGDSYITWFFKRAPSFFDEVCYTGTSVNRTVNHNLGVAPELMILKQRSGGAQSWPVYAAALGATNVLVLDFTQGSVALATIFNSTAPTSSVFSLGTNNASNSSGSTYVAYLFATCPGVSKVGSYTGTGTTQAIACGFTTGARFVLIKRTDAAGDWYVWDSARGIVSGNDPYLLLNIAAAEVTGTDYIDPVSTGFEISSTAPAAINASGGSYIFLAVA